LSKKEKKKKPRHQKQETKTAELIYSKQLNPELVYILYLPFILAIIIGIYFVYSSYKNNGYFGFPLDDPWIHLQFAKNLVEYGSFSYFKNEIVTSGSTSPVYTLLLSLFFLILKNEFIISYVLGIVFGGLLVHITLKLLAINFKNEILLAVIIAFLVALQPKLNLINVSGMETSMFIFLIAASLLAYHSKKMILLGILLGLTIWCRPDGFVLWIAVALDYFLRKYYLKENINYKEILKAFFIAAVFAGGYFIFNYLLSGEILPNTYKAKLEYYQNNDRSLFLENEVLKYFSQDEFVLIWIPFLIGAVGIIISFFKKEKNDFLIYLLFIVGLIAVYYIKLPFAHRFGRYLMPVIPFYLMIAVYGVKLILDFISNRSKKGSGLFPNFLFVVYTIAVIGIFINHNFKLLNELTFFNKYHNDRHVAAGKWLKENTDESDIIATHDVGALAFYSERKILDIAGLITPELINHINDRQYSEYLNNYLAKTKVDYLVTLRNWFEVVNDKPVFSPVSEPEFIEVFKYKLSQTHIQPREVSQINNAAIQMIQNGNTSNALSYLNQSIRSDNRSSQTYFLFGVVYEIQKDYRKAEENFSKAVELHPAYAEAYYGLAKINFDQNKIEDSKIYLNRCLVINPNYQPAIQLWESLSAIK
jgi:arabinofuranosyltransferase